VDKVIKLYRRCCIECGHIWFGKLACPKCKAPGEPIWVEGQDAAV